ncbi:hypothetical protein TNCV_2176841 [Trichonephila clavipes]|uniref:Uncharacterized protein n=1 Tax=Trichonephila clavipes TaxID=2585209 RepID=A0A8X6VTY7_TRICX|nr:hypothetical protein TNCV_2176841 [Trichonephila clavipes]
MPQNLLEHVSASYLLLRLVGYQSSWRSTEDFQYHLRSLCLVFLAPMATTGSAIWRRSVTTYWGSASRGTWRKTSRRVWSAYFFFKRRRSSVGGFESCQRQPFSLGSSALHVQDVRSGNKQDWGSESKDSCVWLTSRWTSSRTIVRIRETKSVSSVRGCNRYDVWKPFKSRSTNSLLLHIFDIVAPFDKTCCVVDFSRQ